MVESQERMIKKRVDRWLDSFLTSILRPFTAVLRDFYIISICRLHPDNFKASQGLFQGDSA
jgi:hypothetical protein